MAAKKKKAKRKAPAKRKAKTKTKRAPSSDRFSQLTAAHARAVSAGEHHFAQLLKRELTKGSKRKRR